MSVRLGLDQSPNGVNHPALTVLEHLGKELLPFLRHVFVVRLCSTLTPVIDVCSGKGQPELCTLVGVEAPSAVQRGVDATSVPISHSGPPRLRR